MYEAAGKARDGDLAYFKSLSALELGSLLVGRDEDGRTLLHTAAAEGHLELLQLLIAAGSGKVANKHDDEVSYEAGCPHCRRLAVISMHTMSMGLPSLPAYLAPMAHVTCNVV